MGLEGGGFGGERPGVERSRGEGEDGEDESLKLHGGFGFLRLLILSGFWWRFVWG